MASFESFPIEFSYLSYLFFVHLVQLLTYYCPVITFHPQKRIQPKPDPSTSAAFPAAFYYLLSKLKPTLTA
ncbi:hypothetical protein, partial [Aliivibrio sifiae]|uniref:hypothetical protein n=1 Tax=Aliivibrio sifiae TaxID=566293 RepID=UPI001C611956